ncbi:ParM/StbA family protein [Paraclostridium bifermentans]|uniref:ParM/StbA family protein n=1 Tax=Paraclostridium bifermentans TaxID=1490 RepID=UPI00241C4DC0|nr:ParM/StbA family protein [Paraclostridium bifermentans]
MKRQLTMIDLGNSYIKTLKGMTIANKVLEFGADENIETLGENTVRLNDRLYFIGSQKAKLNFEYTKTNKTFIPQVLYTISALNKLNDTDLILLLPNDQIENKTIFEETLQNKTFKCEINGKKETIKIGKVITLRESQAAFFSLDREKQSGLSGILDLGSYTTNVFLTDNFKEISNFTVKIGVADYWMGLSSELSKYKKMNEVEVERYFHKIKEEYKEVIDKFTLEFTNKLYDELARNYQNIIYHQLTAVGGGSKLYFDELSKKLDLYKHESPIQANILGCEQIAKLKGLI